MLDFKQYLNKCILLEENIEDFVNFAGEELKLKDIPNIFLVKERQDDMTTACYRPEEKIIKVYSKGRAFFDIARSLAHELVHHMQHETGKKLDGETGSDCENEANALAGQIIRKYGQKNPKFYN
jgi:hypothetical protein